MKKSKFTDAQIAFVLQQAEDGTPVAEVCRKAGIGEATFYNWRKKYGGLMPSEMKRLKQLEEENGKLKRLVADLSLDKAMLQDVVRTLEQVYQSVGYPKAFRVDQGSEFISRDPDLWAYQKNMTLDFSRPDKPTDKAFIESFNGKFRTECLNARWFMTLDDARRKMEEWHRDYNEVRSRSAIGDKPPMALRYRSEAIMPPCALPPENLQPGGPTPGSASIVRTLSICMDRILGSRTSARQLQKSTSPAPPAQLHH